MPRTTILQQEMERLLKRSARIRPGPVSDPPLIGDIIQSVNGRYSHAINAVFAELRRSQPAKRREALLRRASQVLVEIAKDMKAVNKKWYPKKTLPADDVLDIQATYNFLRAAVDALCRKERDRAALAKKAGLLSVPRKENPARAAEKKQEREEQDCAFELDKLGDLPGKERWTWEQLGRLDELAYIVMQQRENEKNGAQAQVSKRAVANIQRTP